MNRLRMSVNYPFDNESDLEPYFRQEVLTAEGDGNVCVSRTHDFFPKEVIKALKNLQEKGFRIVDGVHPRLRDRVPFDGNLEINLGISSNPSELKKLEDAGINLEII
jgi:hypothetical protein